MSTYIRSGVYLGRQRGPTARAAIRVGAPAPALTPRAPLGNPHRSFICKMERADLLRGANLESINV